MSHLTIEAFLFMVAIIVVDSLCTVEKRNSRVTYQCAHSNLTRVPRKNLQRMHQQNSGNDSGHSPQHQVDLSYNSIAILRQKDFINLTQMTTLKLDNNEIRKIQKKTFSRVPHLLGLNLSRNSLQQINQSMFRGLNRLHALILDQNGIKYIEDGSFADLLSLDYLFLEDNDLTELKKDVFQNLRNLRDLLLYNNRIGHIDDGALSGLTRVEFLGLENNRLSRISKATLWGLSALKIIDLSQNVITTIDREAFKTLVKIAEIHLESNNIETIHPGTFGAPFQSLSLLHLLDNPLSCTTLNNIPKKVKNLTLPQGGCRTTASSGGRKNENSAKYNIVIASLVSVLFTEKGGIRL